MINNITEVILRTEVMEYVIYKNNRKFSNIKFSTIDEIKHYIRFSGKMHKAWIEKWNLDVYEYPSGKFVTRLVSEPVGQWKKYYEFTENCPSKTPRNRRFK